MAEGSHAATVAPGEEAPTKPAKKPKLTKAEKKARKLAAMIEFRKLEMREHLKRELILSQRSVQRGRRQWEEMCKEIKITEFRNELQAWGAKTDQLLERKDEKIKSLLDDMDTTQEMHRRNFSRLLQVMDYIYKSYKTMLDSAHNLYESEASEVLQSFYDELNNKQNTDSLIRTNCENIMHATNLVVENQMYSDYKIYLENRDDVVNTEIEKRYRQRDSVVSRMKSLRQQLTTFVDSLLHSTLDVHKFERIAQLMDRQRNFLAESQKLSDLEMTNTRLLSDLQRELLHKELESTRKLNDLKLEQSYFLEVRKNIECKMEEDRQITFSKLGTLCSECLEVLKYIKKMEKSGELLLYLAAMCRKMQTESEKVVPWGDFQEPENKDNFTRVWDDFYDVIKFDCQDPNSDYFKLRKINLKKHFDLTEKELADQMLLMRNFWRRQAIVEAQNLILGEERRKLMEENERYITFIKSMSKTDKVDELLEAVKIKCVLPEVSKPCHGKTRHSIRHRRSTMKHSGSQQLH